ncbi:MAG: 50S ribosomal protein L9 [Planctomycetes bacterium]|nr:50S ribosomal protein L9 [Planctomycetota bacterium]
MELLLKQNIEHLGRLGDVVKVKPGYARNYLLPRGLAVAVTKDNVAAIERARAAAMAEEQKRIGSMKELAQKLVEASITIEGRASDDGHLYGSVTAGSIAKALRDRGIAVDDKQVRLEQPLKQIGTYDVLVHLHQSVEATVKVWVVKQADA